tara:strand:- start:125 stop:310 length:186 start_codon:yes stop_codon:yes gene_type:complete
MKKNVFKFIGVGFEIIITVSALFLIGFKIDEKLQTGLFSIVFSFCGIIVSLYTLYKKVKKG